MKQRFSIMFCRAMVFAVLAMLLLPAIASTKEAGKNSAKNTEKKVEKSALVDEETTLITSDGGLNLDYANHIAVFKTNVVVKDHRGILKAQEMTVHFDPENSQIKTIEARGDVQIVQEGRVAESQMALIKSVEGIIELTGDPKIKQGKDIYSADKITIFSKTNQVLFEPKARLMIFQQPGEKKELF